MIKKYMMKARQRDFYVNVIITFASVIAFIWLCYFFVPFLTSFQTPASNQSAFEVTGKVEAINKKFSNTRGSLLGGGGGTVETENYTIQVKGHNYDVTANMVHVLKPGQDVTLIGDENKVESIQIEVTNWNRLMNGVESE